MMLLFAVAKRLWGAYEPYRFPSLFGDGGFTIAGYRVLWLRVGILGIALGLAGVFALFLRLPRIGLMFRVVASDRAAARLIGIPVHRVEAVAWALSAAFALAVGMLFAPLFSLSSDMMSGFLLTGFTAALLGGLTSFRGALVAGILVGIMDSELSLYASTEWRAVATFAVMLGVLLLRPAGLFGRQAVIRV
jgi:branched-chain amino acid transport system permease protein